MACLVPHMACLAPRRATFSKNVAWRGTALGILDVAWHATCHVFPERGVAWHQCQNRRHAGHEARPPGGAITGNLGPSNRSTRHPLHTERTSSTPKERANKMSTSVRIAAKNATNLAGFGLKLGITFISFLASCVPSLH
jgi:hypothetical protein